MHKFYAVLMFILFLFHDAQLISYEADSNLFIAILTNAIPVVRVELIYVESSQ